MKKVIYLASGNKKKITELYQLLGDLPIEIKDISTLPVPFEVDEDQLTYQGNALKKAKALFELTNEWCLADDSGLEVEMLGGEPGVYSARYAGLPTNDEKNIEMLLGKIKSVEQPKAQFRTVLALVGNGETYFSEGIVEGHLVHKKRGKNGFGYDPIFVPNGFERTFAEIESELKNAISHRAQALQKMKKIIEDNVLDS